MFMLETEKVVFSEMLMHPPPSHHSSVVRILCFTPGIVGICVFQKLLLFFFNSATVQELDVCFRNGDTKDNIKSQPLSPSSVKNGENDKQNESVKHGV